MILFLIKFIMCWQTLVPKRVKFGLYQKVCLGQKLRKDKISMGFNLLKDDELMIFFPYLLHHNDYVGETCFMESRHLRLLTGHKLYPIWICNEWDTTIWSLHNCAVFKCFAQAKNSCSIEIVANNKPTL